MPLYLGNEPIGNVGIYDSQAVNLDEELAEQDNLIEQIQTALEGKAAGSGSSDEFVTGILQGVTTLFADPTLVTYYFDLENIPNLSSKNIIILKVNSTEVESVIAALYRENINNSFNLLIGNFSSGTYENPAIDGSIFSLQANTIDSLLYYAK